MAHVTPVTAKVSKWEDIDAAAVGYLKNFAFTADPNRGPHPPAVRWPRYTNGTDSMLEFAGAAATVRPGLKADQCAFWDARTVPIAR